MLRFENFAPRAAAARDAFITLPRPVYRSEPTGTDQSSPRILEAASRAGYTFTKILRWYIQ